MGFPSKNAEVGSHSLSRESSRPRDWIQASHIVGRFLTIWATKEAPKQSNIYLIRVQEGGAEWEKLFEGIMAKDFPKLMKYSKP